MKKIDIVIIEVTAPTGRGKTTICVSLALTYALKFGVPIVSNTPLKNLPEGVTYSLARKARDLMSAENAVILWDEPYNSFSSQAGYINMKKDKKLSELVSNARKRGIVAIIFSSQLKRAVRNVLRLNSKFALIPTGTLAEGGFPQFLMWNDIDAFEHTRDGGNYDGGRLENVDYTLEYLDTVFDSRDTVIIEW